MGRGRAGKRGGPGQMGWESCLSTHLFYLVLVRFNNPSDLLRRSKRRVRLMFQMMADNLHFDEERLVLDRAAGSGWEWPVGCDGRQNR